MPKMRFVANINTMKFGMILLFFVFLPACTRGKPKKQAKQSVSQGLSHNKTWVQVKFISTKGVFSVHAEVVADPVSRERGLMFRRNLAPEKGMLFVFPHEGIHTFWMKNTLIPLDMIFIDKSKRVVGIVHRAKPLDETPVGPNKPSMYVVEVPGGTAEQKGIVPGARVLFQPKPSEALQ